MPLPQVTKQTEFIPFEGGADFVTPALQAKPGSCREAQNFEIDINHGYRRVLGYERFDGQAKPSDATYAILPVTLSATVNVGDVLTDNAGTSFGTVIALASSNTQAVLTKITGTFAAGNVRVGGVVKGTCSGPAVQDSASTPRLHAQYRNLAADVYRALITAVPGSGNVLGVVLYGDVVYAFRNNAGATAAVMFKSTSSGWASVSLGEEISFTNANTSVEEGDTLTQGGVTATIKRVVVEDGSLLSGVNSGRLILSGRAGGNYAAGAATSTGGGSLTLSGAQTAITLAPSGRFEFVVHNFGGATTTRRLYGADGKNRAWEFDGTTFVPISTGMTTDTPLHIAVHKNQLFLSFGSSAQHSAPGDPYVFNAIVGAGEIAMGDDITGFRSQPASQESGALAIFTRNKIGMLYGTGVIDWNLVDFNQEIGAYAYTHQHVGFTMMLDDRGVTTLSTTLNYGNFVAATVSKPVLPWLVDKRTISQASCVIRDKNQYRLFFNDGSGLTITFDNGNILGMMPTLYAHAIRCAWSSEMADGTEAAFFGDSTGYVFQMEKGTSFDGANIEAYLTLVFNNSRSPLQKKRYRGMQFEVEGDGYAEFDFSYDLSYASTETEQPNSSTITVALQPAVWDSFTWDSFYWDGRNLTPNKADFIGSAENFALRLRSNSDYFGALRVSGALFIYTPRRMLRLGA